MVQLCSVDPRTPAALANHLGQAASFRSIQCLLRIRKSIRVTISQLCVSQRSQATPFIVALLNSGPQPLVGLGATDHCAYGVFPQTDSARGETVFDPTTLHNGSRKRSHNCNILPFYRMTNYHTSTLSRLMYRNNLIQQLGKNITTTQVSTIHQTTSIDKT